MRNNNVTFTSLTSFLRISYFNILFCKDALPKIYVHYCSHVIFVYVMFCGFSKQVTQENLITFFFLNTQLWDVFLTSLRLHRLVIHGVLENHRDCDQHILGTQKLGRWLSWLGYHGLPSILVTIFQMFSIS